MTTLPPAPTHSGPRPRLIPVLLLKHGVIVRSQLFKVHQVIGNPMSTVERYSNWNADELVILDISRGEDRHDLRRDDLQQNYAGTSAINVLKAVAKVCFMPLTFGGRIQSVNDIEVRLVAGADKVTINTAAFDDPDLIEQAARRFGSQCIVASIDAQARPDGGWEVFVDGGRRATGLDPAQWAREMERRGAGEIFLNSIDRDGSALGYDLDLIRHVTQAVAIPVVACGGVGQYEHVAPAVLDGHAAAAAAANIFHFFELSYPHAKRTAIAAGVPMRPVRLGSEFLAREPVYDRPHEDARIAERLRQARDGDYPAARPDAAAKRRDIRWCTECTYPSISAAPMEFDDHGVCTGCQMAKVKAKIPRSEWDRRKELLREMVERYRCKDGSRHDVVIAVSGGKDSYFQVHVLKEEFGLNPLLVTYDGNNWTDAGWRNMVRMREAFGVDHVLVRPSVATLKKLNRQAFVIMGDMNWHGHVGIMTAPMAEAAKRGIPLVFYGEHGYLDLCGQFSMDDFPEVTYRDRLEHFARGYEWSYFVGRDGLTAQDMDLWKYPEDRAMLDLDLRGIFLGNFVYWEANDHIKLVTERYGFEVSHEPFDRTYRTMSNLDDMHENGAHDYLKYIKFGYGRATDHTCKDIRAGLMTRDRAIELVNHYDPIKPSDLYRWLNYVGMSEDEFDRIADTFRDPRVWRMEAGSWVRQKLGE
ncbi:N-acetyl sugar amidotransferase [Magnetospirillum sp. 15-1]|uniref:N-acetyl sugar amidotransferase n=1 Tax=Magnetospirillum sp. 15-1 TaxID=1979370 RepID=UPI000BBBD4EE|nr:N-acetyl sugar amidotransferase [Magnetospirillum sp. 15-1]